MESFALIVKMPFSLSPLLQSSPPHIFAEILPRPAQFHWEAIVLNVKIEAHLEWASKWLSLRKNLLNECKGRKLFKYKFT